MKCRECEKARGMHHASRCSVRTGRKAVREEDCHDPVHPDEAKLSDVTSELRTKSSQQIEDDFNACRDGLD